jgi:diguanylate cyclase (GGDEF)-like protein
MASDEARLAGASDLLRHMEPVAPLALAAHGVAVQVVAIERAATPFVVAVVVLAGLALAGLLGWRSHAAVTFRLAVTLVLGFTLMALREDGSGYVLLWYFVVASVYPLVLPARLGGAVAVVVPLAYLLLLPFDAADGPLPVALLRAVALALIAGFVHVAAQAFRHAVAERDGALATLHTFVEAAPIGLGYWDLDLRARWLNPALADLSGQPAEEHVGRPVTEEEALPIALGLNLHRALVAGRPIHDVELTADGRSWTSSYFPVRDGPRLLGVGSSVVDVTEQREAQRALAYSATHDALTGLPNRTLFRDRLSVALAQAERTRDLVAVLFCDVDRFKTVNDSLGHPGGDALLQVVAERLGEAVRTGDTVARLGGDEFALLCAPVADAAEASAIAERVCAVMREPILVGDRPVTATMSVGVAVARPGERDVAGLLRDADVAMYEAKDAGRDRVAVFDPRRRPSATGRLEFQSALRTAVERGQIGVAFQPVVRLGPTNGHPRDVRGDVVGLEALARWRRPGVGDVPPAAFIPTAEDLGLILALGEHVLRMACARVRRWRDETGLDLVAAVNVSALQLADDGCVDRVAGVLEAEGLPPAALELEITESMLMRDLDQSLRRLSELRALGVSVAVDDFGTGYSSLAYLRDLPVDVLKIDRSFVSRLPDDEAMVRFIVELARAIGATTVVEGVETREQLDAVRRLGCDQAQGYFLSRPLAPEDVMAFLRGRPEPAVR